MIRSTLEWLAREGHSRTSAHKYIGISWHTFRQLCADHPDIQWRRKGEHLKEYRAVTGK